jgi:CRP-like cAMP-binding protein
LLNYDDTTQFEKREVRVLEEGDSFGELALLDNGYKTTATVFAKSVCELACLDRA